ncbi:MAG: signal recognition particle-docking protein FtsY [Planctomycetota bacterium]
MWFARKARPELLTRGIEKTRGSFFSRLKDIFRGGRKLDAAFLAELEETLLAADVGVTMTSALLAEFETEARTLPAGEELLAAFRRKLAGRLGTRDRGLRLVETPPTVIVMAGVNGTGKTTSIAKLAKLLQDDGRSVLLAACDTFRAAAGEQLAVWSGRIGTDLIRSQSGADPGAVAFDAAQAAIARKKDVLVVDTAGRLHTKTNLMEELGKVVRVLGKVVPGAPHEVILVLDGTTGQNAVAQAKQFKAAVGVTGLFLTKLDGTARGGVVLGIEEETGLPVKFVGLGETMDAIAPFDPAAFVEALLGGKESGSPGV